MHRSTSPNLYNHNPNATMSMFCFHVAATSSVGIWLGQSPVQASVPLILYQLTLIFITTRLTHALLRHLGQPLFISQIVAGLLLGPSFGSNNGFGKLLFREHGWEQLNTVSIISFMLFLFVVGVKTDLGMIRTAGRKAVAIAMCGTVLPMVVGHLIARLLENRIPEDFLRSWLIIDVVELWSMTSYTNISWVLNELNLLTSKLGRLAMSASLIADFTHLFVSAGFSAYLLSSEFNNPVLAIVKLCSFLAFFVLVLFVFRPVVLWLIKRTPEGALLDEACFVAIVLLALVCGMMTEALGYHVTLGPFLLGLVLPGGAPLGVTMVERLDRLVLGLFLPVYLTVAGLRANLASLQDAERWGSMELFLVLCVLFKFVGVVLPCLYCRMPLRDAVSLGIMMNIKGIFEADAAVQWQDGQTLDEQLFTIIIVTIVVFGGGTALLVKCLYRPEDRFITYKRRTFEHSRRTDELRVLACTHNEDNVAPSITLLEVSNPSRESPICVYLLHLTQLVGRADAILAPYKPQQKAPTSETDHIVNAFRLFEHQRLGSVTVLPYICISPYATMHDDVCSLALDKKVTFVIIPFHKNFTLDGKVGTANATIQAFNVNVLLYAPCSVGILIDHGLASGASFSPVSDSGKFPETRHRIAVYFIGGADDREALAYAARMAENNESVGLTLLRFLPTEGSRRRGEREEQLDDEAVEGFRQDLEDGDRVTYREEVVKDGEGMVAVIRSTSSQFSLLMVGRREGSESRLTEGMSMWNEFPELGVIGDLMASTDFSGGVATLVVQQQRRLGAGVLPDSPKAKGVFRGAGHQVVPLGDNDDTS